MKDSKVYSKKIQTFYRSVKRKYPKTELPQYASSLDAFVYGIISEHMTEKESQRALKKVAEHFMDWNDLRVSRTDEVVEVLGGESELIRIVGSQLCLCLRAIFTRQNEIGLDSLKKMNKRSARQFLEKLQGSSNYLVDYSMLMILQAHTIPLTDDMLNYLSENELVHPNSDGVEIEGFLARQIPAKNGYEFYCLLRCASEAGGVRKKKKTAKEVEKEKTTKKVKKKVAKKKKKKTVTKKKPGRKGRPVKNG